MRIDPLSRILYNKEARCNDLCEAQRAAAKGRSSFYIRDIIHQRHADFHGFAEEK